MWVGKRYGQLRSLPSDPRKKSKGWKRDTAVSETTQLPVDRSGGLYDVQSSWPVQCDRRVKASGTQTYWPVQCDGTSEVFWKSSRPGLSSPSDGRRVKASGKVAQPT